VSSLDRIIAGAHALAKAGANFRDFEHEQHRLQLQLVTGSDQAVVILAAAAKIQPPNTGTAERTAIELAKAGFTAQQIDAALPTIFEAHYKRPLAPAVAIRRAELLATWTNTLALTPEQIRRAGWLVREHEETHL
jgi:hypothetical protein